MERQERAKLRPLGVANVKLREDGFWGRRVRQVREEVVPYQWRALNDAVPGAPRSHAMENLRIAAGLATSEFYGFVFQDSDVAKWLEAVSYCLACKPDPELERLADEVIDIVLKAQQPDGYLNSYFTIKEPSMRWRNLRDNHELYCAGHWIEAGVAHYQATGRRTLLNAVCRLADHINSLFGPEPGKKKGYPGHPEIELALVKLYRITGEKRYLDLSKYFVDERGKKPLYFELEAKERGEESPKWPGWTPEYCQAHLPVREQAEAVGHAVRAMYLYCAMADLAKETGDAGSFIACEKLWKDVTGRKMYITGGIGSQAWGESFTHSYDLPSDRAYAETCAAIGLVFGAHRMLHLDPDRKYADIMERALFNGVLSGISLDGTKYFYTNPLEVWPEACQGRHDLRHVLIERQPWFDCACCPPNLARLLASVGQYVYSYAEDTVYVHLFTPSEVTVNLVDRKVRLIQETDYPWAGDVALEVQSGAPLEFILAIRIPSWCKDPCLRINGELVDMGNLMENGYAKLKRKWCDGDKIILSLPMPIERIHAHPTVRATAGKVAIARGPLVYCLEEVDNGPQLHQLILPSHAELWPGEKSSDLDNALLIHGKALRIDAPSWNDMLYSSEAYEVENVHLTAAPYCTWANRKPGEMLIWIREV